MTFTKWLSEQIQRDDPIGDLARDVATDKRPKPRSLNGWRAWLRNANACSEALEALDEAWDEWCALGETGDVHDDAEKAYRRGVHQAYVMLGYFLQEVDLPVDIVLQEATKRAADMRGSTLAIPSLLDRLFSGIKRDFNADDRK